MKINKKNKLKRYKNRIERREYLKKVSITFGKGLIGYNKSIEEVMPLLKRAIRGQTEPIRRTTNEKIHSGTN